MEALVIIDQSRTDGSTGEAIGRVRKSQEFSDRLFVVEGDPGAVQALRGKPGVTIPERLTDETVRQLSPMERLSAESWLGRTTARKDRAGDGLSWGHKDFQAPR